MSSEVHAVQVAVRVRPFNEREKAADSSCIVAMKRQAEGSTVTLSDEKGQEKTFNVDFTLQSHSPSMPEFASQEDVFEELGKPVMDVALEGHNVCLFAYGQTGSGKSHSMLGDDNSQGIVPRICENIFKRIATASAEYVYSVDVQVVEIYCEKIRDLLANRKTWTNEGKELRMCPILGYIVRDAVKRPCTRPEEIKQAFSFAERNRTIGSHALNQTSSRAHTIYTVMYTRRKVVGGATREVLTSQINLVDLAGSERTDVAATEGQMLKEGNAINLSLSNLGQVINTLSKGKGRPPYRESKLTQLLQGSMETGRVLMIAAVSPANINYKETLSTLRFAQRAKTVKIRSKINKTEDFPEAAKKAMNDMKAKMQKEIDELTRRIEDMMRAGDLSGAACLREGVNILRVESTDLASAADRAVEDVEEGLGARTRRANELAALHQAREANRDEPHLANLHEDDRLSGLLVYPLKRGRNILGKPDPASQPDIALTGVGVTPCHAIINYEGASVTLSPGIGGGGRMWVNGKRVEGSVPLKHNNRVWIGNNYALRFVHPKHEAEGESKVPDYHMAEREIAQGHASGDYGKLPVHIQTLISQAMRKVEQANYLASQLSKRCQFTVRLFLDPECSDPEVGVEVVNAQGTLYWSWEKMTSRVEAFLQEWMKYSSDPPAYVAPTSLADPFHDATHQKIGTAVVWLKPLGHMVSHTAAASILSPVGQPIGQLSVRMGPWTGSETYDEDLDPFVEDPFQLLGQPITFLLHVADALFQPQAGSSLRYHSTLVRYCLPFDDDGEPEWMETRVVPEQTMNPLYNWGSTHRVQVTREVLDIIRQGKMVFELWGKLSCGTEDGSLGGDGDILEAKRRQVEKLERQQRRLERQISEQESHLDDLGLEPLKSPPVPPRR